MGTDIWNELEGASKRLIRTQENVRLGRTGIRNPADALLELEVVLVGCSKVFDKWQSSQHANTVSGNQALLLLRFNITVARGCSQFLEYAKEFPQLPDPHLEDIASLERSAQIRLGFLRVIENIDTFLRTQLVKNPIIEPFYLELETLKLKAEHAINAQKPNGNSSIITKPIISRAKNLFQRAINSIASGAIDPEEIFQWCAAGAVSILLEIDPQRGIDLLEEHDLSTLDDSVSWELSMMRAQALVNSPSRNNEIQKFVATLKESRLCDEKERLGRAAMATRPVHQIASQLVENSDIGLAVSVLEAYAVLNGNKSTDENLLRTFVANDKLYGILSTRDREIALKADLTTDDILPLLEASVSGSPEGAFGARKLLGQRLRPLVGHADIAAAEPLTIDAHGFTGWFPWHAISTGSGQNLGTKTDLRWRHPLGGSRNSQPLELSNAVLVVDEALRESTQLIQAWQKMRNGLGKVVTYSSDAEGISEDTFRGEFESSSMFIYFGHGVSDPEDSDNRGLYLGPDRIITSSRLRTLSGSGVSAALIVACESGRQSPFVGGSSPAQAIANSGVPVVISSLWTIWARDGAKYATDFINAISVLETPDATLTWLELAKNTTAISTPFYCMQ